jgi:hypothetical protein
VDPNIPLDREYGHMERESHVKRPAMAIPRGKKRAKKRAI